MGWLKSHGFLVLILIVAAIVRFWGFPEMDYHHDEISALLRTHVDSFDVLVAHGIRVDGHPGFVQWFLWVWTAWFGYAPWIVKLPFILSGIASVGLMYGVGKSLFSNRVGWMAAVLMGVMQYGVIYSQWARPYAFGMFFLLVATWSLSNYLKFNRIRALLIFAFAAALCGYSHYMALLQVIVVAGMLIVFKSKRSQWKWLITGSLFAFLIWVPHLNVTLHHLVLGGIGDWLQPPKADFWVKLLAVSFNHSWWVGGLLIFLIAGSLARFRWIRKDWILRGLLLGMTVIPYTIVYLYSHQVNAIMHVGSMFFILPFLFLFVASFVQAYHRDTVLIFGILIMVTGVQTLFGSRQHVAMNLRTEYQDPLRYLDELRADQALQLDNKKIRVAMDLRPDAVRFLHENAIVDYSRVELIEPLWKRGLWSHYLDTTNADALWIVTTPASVPEYLTTAQCYFPSYTAGRSYHTGNAHLLLRKDPATRIDLKAMDADQNLSGEEFGRSLSAELSNKPGFHFLLVSAGFSGRYVGNAQLVYEWTANNGMKAWRASFFKDFRQASPKQQALLGGDVRDLPGFESGGVLKAYVWNPGLNAIRVDRMQVVQCKGISGRYGLFGEVSTR
ncbi:MAG: glycosyltransferase family 39 protein [Cryomorphaceae bacterium]